MDVYVVNINVILKSSHTFYVFFIMYANIYKLCMNDISVGKNFIFTITQ